MLLILADRSALCSIVSLISKALVFCVSQCQQQIFWVLKSSLVWLAVWGFYVYSREYLLPFSEVERTHIVTACSWKEPIPLIWALLHHKLLLAYFNALRSWLIVWSFFPAIVAEGPVWVHISLCCQRSDCRLTLSSAHGGGAVLHDDLSFDISLMNVISHNIGYETWFCKEGG